MGVFLLVIIILFFIPAHASDKPLFRERSDTPWHITADVIEYDEQASEYVGRGNVTITKDDKKLSADLIRFNHDTMEALAQGNMIMTAGEDVLTGTRIEIDLKTETGTIYDASIFLKENHFYIKGKKIQKVGKDSYEAYKASISSCDGDTPDWKITGRNLSVTMEGYGVVTHAALWAKTMPIMYVPFFAFPAKQKRQSGLLIPQLGHSDRKGAEYHQPFYWAINDHSDATFYLHYMKERGTKLGGEYRYVLDGHSKGTLMYDFLNDSKTDHLSDPDNNWGYEDDDVPRPNSDRYWFRMKHDQALPGGFLGKLDIDIISDQDYLHEFEDGYTGFEETNAYFGKNFGRGLDDHNDPTRVSSLGLSNAWGNYSLNIGARWYDHVVSRRQRDTDTTLHKLPFIQLGSIRHQIPKSPFFWEIDSEYIHFHREDGMRGHRADLHPRVSLPVRFKNRLTIEPCLGLRETIWHVDGQGTDTRHLYDIRTDISSNLFKVFRLDQKEPGFLKSLGSYFGISQIRHVIRPQITYEYIPSRTQDEHPVDDPLDQIEKKNRVTCSVTNILTTASKTKEYRQLCRFKLEQSYDIDEARETDPLRWATSQEKRPFSPIYGEIDLTPNSFLSVHADAEWSFYENRLQSRNVAVSLSDHRGDSLFVTHRRTQALHESVYAEMRVRLSDRFSMYADYEHNLEDEKEIRNSLGVLYAAPCWSLDLRHTYETGDHKYAFMINLNGLGGLGVNK